MNELARKSLRGRWTQVLGVAITLAFAATLVGGFGLLLETGARGEVSTGEYAAPPLVVGARQTLPVAEDADVAVTGRATLPAGIIARLRAAAPHARIVADRVTPAVLAGPAVPVSVHPWSAFALGNRALVSGRAPRDGEIVLPAALHRAFGSGVRLGFGDTARRYTLVGTTDADDSGVDDPDVYLSDRDASRLSPRGRVAAVGVWPTRGGARVRELAEQRGARVWPAGRRGGLEVVRQWAGRQTLVSIGGAAAGLASIVAIFTIVAPTGLQIRERSRELALLRVIGATPTQVKRLLRSEVRWIAGGAAIIGSGLGQLLGLLLLHAAKTAGISPASLRPAFGPLPVGAAIAVTVLAAEIAARLAMRRLAAASPPAVARGGGLTWGRALGGVLLLAAGAAMVAAPAYVAGEAAVALPSLSGLILAIAVAMLSPGVVTGVLRALRRLANRSVEMSLAFSSMRDRPARVGGALAPLLLGVALACVQLFPLSTMAAIGADQARAGVRADLTVSSTGTGVAAGTIAALRALPAVASVQPVVSTDVDARGPGHDATWQTISALGVTADPITYADLRPRAGGALTLHRGDVAIGAYAAATLGVAAGDRIAIARPDGSVVERRITAVYDRELGFGQIVLSIADLQSTTPTGRPTGAAIALRPGATATAREAVAAIVSVRPGLSVSASPIVADPGAGTDEASLQALLLIVLFGYIAIAVANSVVVTTLARSREIALLRVIGTTPTQLRRIGRVEGLFLAAAACAIGTAIALPGLVTGTSALSQGTTAIPSIQPVWYAGVAAITFALALGATSLCTRVAMRRAGGARAAPG